VRFSYVGGQVADAVGRVAVPLGSTITLEVTSDTTDEVHLHGYDVSVPVAPGAPASLTFTADIRACSRWSSRRRACRSRNPR